MFSKVLKLFSVGKGAPEGMIVTSVNFSMSKTISHLQKPWARFEVMSKEFANSFATD
jgi:hypothetical protein